MKKIILLFLFAILSLSSIEGYSPTKTFIENHPIYEINAVLNKYGMTEADKQLFKSLIDAENEYFVGYHGGSSTYMIFQDIIRIVIEEKLNIPIREGFHFLRVPGNNKLRFSSANAFISKFIHKMPIFSDDRSETRIHILSLNTNLYQSYDLPWDLTPRYYLENKPWTTPAFASYLEDFFKDVGLDPTAVEKIILEVLPKVSRNRGFFMQFYDYSENHSFLNTHYYVAHSGGNPYGDWTPSDFLLYPLINKQLRLVIDNKHILNPFGNLQIKRYDSMSDQQRKLYEETLRQAIQRLPVDEEIKTQFKNRLMKMWAQK